MFPPVHPTYTEDDVGRIQSEREERALLIDTMLEEADVESESTIVDSWGNITDPRMGSSDLYPPTDQHTLDQLFQSLATAPRLQRDLIAYYLLLDTSPDSVPAFASKRHLPQIHTQRVRAFWYLDRERLHDAVKLLSRPGAWSGFVDEERMATYQDVVLDVLAAAGNPALVNTFIEGSGMARDTPQRREYSVRAFASDEGRFREAWRYVRDLEFQDEMQGRDVDEMEDGEMNLDEEDGRVERREEAAQEERKRLLAVVLDAILIRESPRYL